MNCTVTDIYIEDDMLNIESIIAEDNVELDLGLVSKVIAEHNAITDLSSRIGKFKLTAKDLSLNPERVLQIMSNCIALNCTKKLEYNGKGYNTVFEYIATSKYFDVVANCLCIPTYVWNFSNGILQGVSKNEYE
jgi:hypothetical protein